MVKREAAVRELYDYYKSQLLLAAEEKTANALSDPRLDLLLLSLVDRLDILEWVLDIQSEYQPVYYLGDNIIH